MSLPRIGQLLVDAQVIRPEQLEEALRIKEHDGRKLGQILVDTGMASETLLTQTLSRQLSIPWVSLHHLQFSRTLLSLVSRETAQTQGVLPLFVQRAAGEEPILYVAIDDPTNEALLAALASEVRMIVRPMIASPNDLRRAIETFYGASEQAEAATIPPSDRILGSHAFDLGAPDGDAVVWSGPTMPSTRPPASSGQDYTLNVGSPSPLGAIARAIAISLPSGEVVSMLAPPSHNADWELFLRDLLAKLEQHEAITGFTFAD